MNMTPRIRERGPEIAVDFDRHQDMLLISDVCNFSPRHDSFYYQMNNTTGFCHEPFVNFHSSHTANLNYCGLTLPPVTCAPLV